jgi:hypothetical protein
MATSSLATVWRHRGLSILAVACSFAQYPRGWGRRLPRKVGKLTGSSRGVTQRGSAVFPLVTQGRWCYTSMVGEVKKQP